MIPSNWMTVSVVSLSHCFEDWEVPGFALQRMTKPQMVTKLQESVTSREKIPSTAKVMAKNILPGTALSPVLIKHQVPGHWRVYFPTPTIGSSAKSKIRHHMTARVNLVTLVFMWLEYQCGFVMAVALSIAITLAINRAHNPKVVMQTPKKEHKLPEESICSHFRSAL